MIFKAKKIIGIDDYWKVQNRRIVEERKRESNREIEIALLKKN